MKINFILNEHPITIDENPSKRLSSFLREQNYFSVKSGCNTGKCGACTVLVNNTPIPACSISLAKIDSCEVTTLESFMKKDDYSDIEKGFKQANISLCGFCNAGKIFLAYNIISTINRPTKEEISKSISF